MRACGARGACVGRGIFVQCTKLPLSRAECPRPRPHSSYPIISFWPCSAYCKRRFRVISGWAKTACPCTHSFDGGCRWALGGGERGGELCPITPCLDLHSNLPTWCRSPDPNPPGNWPRKICFETASDWYRPGMLYSKILPASRKVHASTLPRQL